MSSNQRITPAMARLRLTGDLDDWQDNGTDQHVALYCLPAEAPVPEQVSSEWMRAHWLEVLPRLRRYTIRHHDPVARAVEIDMVLHDDGGPAAGFAATAEPGDRVIWWGPTAAYEPAEAEVHVLLADETGLPAVAAILEELPADSAVRALVEIPDLADAQDDICIRADADLRWLPRNGESAGRSDVLLAAVRELRLVPGRCRVWAAGERAQMRALRTHLRAAGLPRTDLHVVAYWEYGVAQDAVSERRDRERAAEMRRRRAVGERAAATLPDDDDGDEDDEDDDGLESAL